METENFSTNELISLALNEENDDMRWKHIVVFHLKGTKEVFEAAKSLCESNDSKRITLGADILGQLGIQNLPFKKESIPILLELSDSIIKSSKNEEDTGALQAVVIALGKMESPESWRKVSEFKNHPIAVVREAVAFGLCNVEENYVTEVLISLSEDSDEDVRNWATFGLGQRELDSDEIREALVQRLDEKTDNEICNEIRGEALVGLAIRKDERVIEPLIKELCSGSVGLLTVEAAFEIADSRLCEPLLQIKDRWDINEKLMKDAIEQCCEEKD